MHAVGDMTDGHFGYRHAAPEVVPHVPRDVAVQAAHAIGPARVAQGQDGHLEGVAARAGHAADIEEVTHAQADVVGVAREVLHHELVAEALVAGVNGRVRGEHAARADDFASFLEAQVVTVHEIADALEDEEGGVPFIHVVDGRRDAELVQEHDAAHAEEDFLTDAEVPVRHVQAVRDLTVIGGIFGQIGVHEVELDGTHAHKPDPGEEPALRELQADLKRIACAVPDELHGKLGDIVLRVDGDLPAVLVDLLFKVAVAVEEADGHQRDIEIAGASPETLAKLTGTELSTFPLAGTRPRGKTKQEDRELEEGLLKDEKELAEHNMLVDLGRNDIGRISKIGTVEVEKYMSIEHFSQVMHIGSTVAGELREDKDAIDAVDAILPAGTLSGAPKFRACQIIEELEQSKRGIYGGAIGYLDFAGNLDTCIAIRLVYKKKGEICIRSGAGIVADSVPEKEFEECCNKARAVVLAINKAQEGLE